MRTIQRNGHCDLCGEYGDFNRRRFAAKEFGIEGWICGTCLGELQEEQAEAEHAAIHAAWVEPARPGDLSELLTVLSPPFRLNDLALHAVVRLEIAGAKRRARRLANYQPKAVVLPDPGPPCVQCGTTGGRLHPNQNRPIRLEGAKYGSPGLNCKLCYDRVHRPTSLRGRIALAS